MGSGRWSCAVVVAEDGWLVEVLRKVSSRRRA